jgi:hypothetical protein
MDRTDIAAATQPEALRATLAANADRLRSGAHRHSGSGGASVRSATYKGHEIVIRTTYEITVDGHPFAADVIVDNSGRVHYHGLPTRDFTSTIALVKKAIDFFPEDFPAGGSAPGRAERSGHAHAGKSQKGDS